MEKTEMKKQTDDVLLNRVEALEEFFGRPFHEFVTWKTAYDLPLEKQNGFPALSMKKFQKWAEERCVADVNPKNITTTDLETYRKKMSLLELPSRPLDRIQAISAFVGYPQHIVLAWQKDFVDCPITKSARKYQVDSRELLVWMFKSNIQMGHHRETFEL
jgi:hypothetical protein